jgi:tRNA(fMet)-specific endonuclease VapC
MVYLLDTNHYSRMLLGGSEVVEQLQAVRDEVMETCAIVRGELLFMAERSERRQHNRERVLRLLEEIDVHPVTPATAEVYGELKARLMARFGPRERAKARRTSIQQLGFGDNDLWIAAVTLERRLILVTADRGFRRMAEVSPLRVETWWKARPPEGI